MLNRRIRLLRHKAAFLISRWLIEDWNIGIVRGDISDVMGHSSFPEVTWLPDKPAHCFYADPFGYSRNHELNIFFEEYDHRKQTGSIQRIVLDVQNRIISKNRALNNDVHSSYPYIIEHEGESYAVPEVSKSGKVVLYKIDRETGRFTEAHTLLDNVMLSDPTVFRHEGRWWLFGIINGPRLFAWYSDNLFGPWHEHGNNPVKTDRGSARPAGKPFILKDRLYRPSQDSTTTYGGRIAINKIIALSPADFEEQLVQYIELDPAGRYPFGPHTISIVESVILIDGKRYMFHPRLIAGKFIKKMYNIVTSRNTEP